MGDNTTELASPPLVVLVVEDEALILAMVVSALEGARYGVRVAASGIEAMTVMDDQAELRALVTDVDLGEGPNGWDVAKRARERAPTIPVIYVTGGSQADWSANGVPNSMLIAKPFVPAQIVTGVSQLLNDVVPLE